MVAIETPKEVIDVSDISQVAEEVRSSFHQVKSIEGSLDFRQRKLGESLYELFLHLFSLTMDDVDRKHVPALLCNPEVQNKVTLPLLVLAHQTERRSAMPDLYANVKNDLQGHAMSILEQGCQLENAEANQVFEALKLLSGT